MFLNHEELVHESEFEVVIIDDQTVGIAHPLQQDGDLVGTTVLLNGFPDQLDYQLMVEVGCREVFFELLILASILTLGEGLGFLGNNEALSDFGVFLNLLLDELEDRDIHHVELDSQVRSDGIYGQKGSHG
jgi:hypothetical protein